MMRHHTEKSRGILSHMSVKCKKVDNNKKKTSTERRQEKVRLAITTISRSLPTGKKKLSLCKFFQGERKKYFQFFSVYFVMGH